MNDKFSELGLSAKVAAAAVDAGYTVPTEIQIMAIPRVLEKRDVIGIAQTGTGKTAGFVLPMLTLLEKGRARARMPRTLILEPTRELAAQVHENFEKYGKNHKLTVALLIGGVSFDEQNKKLDRGADVLIATPGRLLDHFERGRLLMSGVDIFVIDEADRMLDMGFIHDVRKIVALCPKKRQTLLFSATMPPTISKLAHDILNEPVRVDISPVKVTVDRIEQRVYFVSANDKRTVLTDLVKDKATGQAIVFTRTKRGADRVCRHLVQEGVDAVALHGNKAQNARVRALDSFRSGRVRILVATDIAARGIDVPGISHVINFELPNEPESYVHRIGRTARAGAQGIALSLCDPTERAYLRAIERLMRTDVDVAEHRLAETREEAAQRQPTRTAAARPSANKRRRRPRGRRPNGAAGSNMHGNRRQEAQL